MDAAHLESAEWMRELLLKAPPSPVVFRTALTGVPAEQRDAWLDHLLGLDSVPDDGPQLPAGCVPYWPCSVDAVLRMVDLAGIQPSDVFVDVGAGVGRAAALVHLLTGAPVIGLEIQPDLVRAARELSGRLNLQRFSPVEGDAVLLTGLITIGSVFFLYCPFSGERLEKVLDDLEPIARTRELRVVGLDLPLPSRPWLTLASSCAGDLAVYRSTLLASPAPG